MTGRGSIMMRAKTEIEKAKTQVAASTAFGDFHAIEQTRSANCAALCVGPDRT